MTDRQFGPGFQDVIIVERNTVPLEDLERIIAEEPAIDSVAILYGASHMPDLAVRLVQSEHGYEEVDVRWDRAIGVDLETSPLTERDRKSIRRSIRLALAGLKREARLAAQSEAASDDE